MNYLKIPLRYPPKREDAKQGVEWWDAAVMGILFSLRDRYRVETWAASADDLDGVQVTWEEEASN